MFDAELFKQSFPLFQRTENQSLIYLDNAATTQKPQSVIDAITGFYLSANGNAQRASHRLARAATTMVEEARVQAATFLGASSEQEVIFTHGTTEALNLLAYGLSSWVGKGDKVLLSHMEHHANLLPWQKMVQSQGAELEFFPVERGVCQWDLWSSVVDEKTRIIALSAASNVLGTMTDLSIIAHIKQRYPDIIVVLDAAQIAAHIPLQAVAWQCDFLVCSAHKFYGPTGVGLLYGRQEHWQRLSPLILGGEMAGKVELQSSTYQQGVHRFEAGTSSLAAIAGLRGCLSFWQKQDRTAMVQYEQELNHYLHHRLQECLRQREELLLLTQAENNVGIATLAAKSDCYSLFDLAVWFDEHDIAVRVGDHCAQPLWQSLESIHGVNKGLRFSLAAYNTQEDIDRVIKVMEAFFQALDRRSLDVQYHLELEELSTVEWESLLPLGSWQKRYKMLLAWGQKIIPKPFIHKEGYRVKGCESAVWLKHEWRYEKYHYFLVDSDSAVIKGLSALLLLWLNGKTTEEIMAIDLVARYQQISLDKYLSPSRINGFTALIEAAQQLAKNAR